VSEIDNGIYIQIKVPVPKVVRETKSKLTRNLEKEFRKLDPIEP